MPFPRASSAFVQVPLTWRTTGSRPCGRRRIGGAVIAEDDGVEAKARRWRAAESGSMGHGTRAVLDDAGPLHPSVPTIMARILDDDDETEGDDHL